MGGILGGESCTESPKLTAEMGKGWRNGVFSGSGDKMVFVHLRKSSFTGGGREHLHEH